MNEAVRNPNEHSQRSIWRQYAISTVAACCCLVLFFYQTTLSLVDTWSRSDTFAHGFIILPISGWLIWERREKLVRLQPEPQYWGLVALCCSGFFWLLGSLAGVLVLQQMALVLMLISAVWSILGNQVTKAMAFPLAYLFFCVPMGEDLIPLLMEYTASFTIGLLKITGIPVYREGLYFFLPTGSWSVVEACSGIRYLIASVTLGCLYAYLTYTSLKKRLVFIFFSVLVPIVANGLRAYMIVMIGHLSEMKLATGVDHIIYGWVFFGFIILLMFGVGAIWRDHEVPLKFRDTKLDSGAAIQVKSAGKITILTLLIGAAWPLFAQALDQHQTSSEGSSLQQPEPNDDWMPLAKPKWTWEPQLFNADNLSFSFFTDGFNSVGLYLGQYLTQRQDAEAVNSRNTLLSSSDKNWRITESYTEQVQLHNDNLGVKAAHIVGRSTSLVVWHWYRIGSKYTSSTYTAKLLEVLNRLTFSRLDGTYIVVALETTEDSVDQELVLQEFLDSMLPSIEKALDMAANEGN